MIQQRTVVVGDIHGHVDRFTQVLREAHLIDQDGQWSGGSTTLVLMGDFFNRGPHGIDAVEFVMTLEPQAAQQGGSVQTLLGNHDVLLLAAHHFGTAPVPAPGGSFLAAWQRNGGVQRDLELLTEHQISWLSTRPAMIQLGDDIVVHADAMLYTHYGNDLCGVNTAVANVLAERDLARWDELLGAFAERDAFRGTDGLERLNTVLSPFGGRRLIYGYTPIARVTELPPAQVSTAFVYVEGKAINVDHGLCLGGQGFVYEP